MCLVLHAPRSWIILPKGTNRIVDNNSSVALRFALVSNLKPPNEQLQRSVANHPGDERYFKPLINIIGLALIFFLAATNSFAQVPNVRHVLVVLEENTNYADVCGPDNTSMPFLCSLKSQGSFSANYYAPTHPSIGNYDDLGWGVVTTNDDSCAPNTCGFPYSGDSIVRELQTASQTWKGYAESLPSTCYFGGDSGQYAVRHSPIPYISDVQSNCLNRYVAFEDPDLGFAHDLANDTLPNYAFITPNLCDDAHDCTIPGSPIPDRWLQNNVVQPLLNSGHLNPTTGDTILIVTFDESNTDNANGGGLIYWFMMGKGVKQNYQSTGPSVSPGFYSHESTLRVIAEMLGASVNGLGGAANAPDMAEFFGTSSNSPPSAGVSPTSLTFGSETVGTSSAVQTVTLSNTGNSALAIASIATSGDFAETNNCGSSLAAGENCSINVTFTPTASSTRTGNLSVSDNAPGNPQTVALAGLGQDFSLALSSSSTATVTAGQTANYSLEITPAGGFNQIVALSCTGAPASATCSLSLSSVALNGSTPVSVTVAVATGVNSSSMVEPLRLPQVIDVYGFWFSFAGLGALAAICIQLAQSRQRSACLLRLLAFICIIALAGAISSCNNGGVGSNRTDGTPAGTYNLTVAGTFGSGSTTLTHITNLRLVVK
jgi:Phosphoesterase family/Abnormal spindle-like microcephaly-assoc'd, ASPM-SPD-2-Hydin